MKKILAGCAVAVAVTRDGHFGGHAETPVDHHLAHATYAFHSSPFDDAVVVVCDSSIADGWTAWRATGSGLTSVNERWELPLARIYSQLTTVLGLSAGHHEHIVEALARLGGADRIRRLTPSR